MRTNIGDYPDISLDDARKHADHILNSKTEAAATGETPTDESIFASLPTLCEDYVEQMKAKGEGDHHAPLMKYAELQYQIALAVTNSKSGYLFLNIYDIRKPIDYTLPGKVARRPMSDLGVEPLQLKGLRRTGRAFWLHEQTRNQATHIIHAGGAAPLAYPNGFSLRRSTLLRSGLFDLSVLRCHMNRSPGRWRWRRNQSRNMKTNKRFERRQ